MAWVPTFPNALRTFCLRAVSRLGSELMTLVLFTRFWTRLRRLLWLFASSIRAVLGTNRCCVPGRSATCWQPRKFQPRSCPRRWPRSSRSAAPWVCRRQRAGGPGSGFCVRTANSVERNARPNAVRNSAACWGLTKLKPGGRESTMRSSRAGPTQFGTECSAFSVVLAHGCTLSVKSWRVTKVARLAALRWDSGWVIGKYPHGF